MLADVVIRDGLPKDWKDQAAVFYSWFESVGFNRPALRRRSEGLYSFCPAHET